MLLFLLLNLGFDVFGVGIEAVFVGVVNVFTVVYFLM